MMTSGGEIRKVLLARGKQMIQNFWDSSPQYRKVISRSLAISGRNFKYQCTL